MMQKFADYPVVMLDIYGRERHPESTGSAFVQESYNDRRQRAELMLWTYKNTTNGAPPSNRFFLMDEDPPPELLLATTSTIVTHMYGGRPQGGIVIDLNGKIIVNQQWERPEQIDEVLSNIFGIAPGF